MDQVSRRKFIIQSAQVASVMHLSVYACSGSEMEIPEDGDTVIGESTTGTGMGTQSGSMTSGGGGSSTSMQGGTDGSSGAVDDSEGNGSSGAGSTQGVDNTSTTTAAGDSTSESSSSTSESVCELTDDDIEGPFYRPGIPVGSNLDQWGDRGVALLLEGRVTGEDCQPLANAVVEIWHATPSPPGEDAGETLAEYDSTQDYRYYSQVATGADGSFAFQTLRPGWYLNGAQYRPAHIHVKIWVGGVERLTTQLYFMGDPFGATDPWFNPELALDPSPTGRAEIDFVV